jgi:hypothetical protein
MHQTQGSIFGDLAMPAARSLSKKGFAEHVGVSPGRVSQLIKAGLPMEPNGRIPIDEGVRWYAANVDSNRSRAAGIPDGRGAAAAPLTPRAERDAAEAVIARLKAERLAGNLVSRPHALRFIESRARMERDAWIAWINRAAPAIAAATGADMAAILTTLDGLVREQLAALAERPLEGLSR